MLRRARSKKLLGSILIICSAQLAWANPPTQAVVLSGQEAPGHGIFRTFTTNLNVALNNRGDLLFRADDDDDFGVWLWQRGALLASLYHANDHPAGLPEDFRLSDPSSGEVWYLNESGQTIVNSCCNGQGGWLASLGSLRYLADPSNPPAGISGTVTRAGLLHINDSGDVIVSYKPALSDGVYFAGQPDNLLLVGSGSADGQPMLDNSGRIAFLGSRSGSTGLWLGPISAPRLIATGDANHRLDPPFLSKNGHIAFTGSTPSGTPALLVGAPGTDPVVVLRSGDPAPGFPGHVIGIPLLPRINDQGQVAIDADMDGHKGFWAGAPNALKLVAIEGGNAPADVPAVTFDELGGLPVLNNRGQLLFRGYYRDPVTSGKIAGLWATDLDDELHLIARQFGQLEFDGQTKTISDLGFRFDINDSGQMTYIAQFTDGSSGVFLTVLPEPTTALSLLPSLLLFRRRRLG